MPIYRIADLNVEVNPKFKICRKRLESYAVKSNESGKTDIAISFRMTKSVSVSGFPTTSANKVRRMF